MSNRFLLVLKYILVQKKRQITLWKRRTQNPKKYNSFSTNTNGIGIFNGKGFSSLNAKEKASLNPSRSLKKLAKATSLKFILHEKTPLLRSSLQKKSSSTKQKTPKIKQRYKIKSNFLGFLTIKTSLSYTESIKRIRFYTLSQKMQKAPHFSNTFPTKKSKAKILFTRMMLQSFSDKSSKQLDTCPKRVFFIVISNLKIFS